MKLFTIGFTQTSAEHFFSRLDSAGVQMVLDTRINRDGQLSGFAKASDLQYFLKSIVSIKYRVEEMLAPPAELLKSYRTRVIDWANYESQYRELLKTRRIEDFLAPQVLDNACLLCSESTTERCHRRLAAEYLKDAFPDEDLTVIHL
jgi:uncharacterized protein (DUF488 family)